MGFEVKYCCFGVELRTGSLIIAYLNLLANITLIMLLIDALVTLQVAGSFDYSQQLNPNDSVETFAIVMFCILLALVLFNLMAGVVLLVGLHKYKPGCVKFYLIFTSIVVAISALMVLSNATRGIDSHILIRDTFSIALNIYFLIVLRSYYLKMTDPEKTAAIDKILEY